MSKNDPNQEESMNDLPKIGLLQTQQAASVAGAETDHNKVSASDRGEDQPECRTPTSDEHKIPSGLICPPAPKKPRRTSTVSCKRKLELDDQIQFFEIVKREEVDEYFRSNFELAARSRMINVVKKRCKCVT